MSAMSEPWINLSDREQIRDCLARLARGEDRRDATLLRSAYWPDATDDHGIFTGTFDEYLAWVVPGAPSVLLTLHTLGQRLIELRGTSAHVETHISAYHRIDVGSEQRDIFIGGRYLDSFEKRDTLWRIAKRTMLYDWVHDAGQSVDWSHGLLGMPFLTARALGSAHDDPSVTFFAQRPT